MKEIMKPEQIVAIVSVALTILNVGLTYLNLRHSRKKDFQETLYQIKLDAYKLLNERCYSAVKRLDINSTPYVQIYEHSNKKEWVKYCEKEMGSEIIAGFELQDLVYSQAMYLPTEAVDKFYTFSGDCISFVTMVYHFDAGLIISNQNKLWEAYIDLLNTIRGDLKIKMIDIGLKGRLSSKI